MSLFSLLAAVLPNENDRLLIQTQIDDGEDFHAIVDAAPAHIHSRLSLACTLLKLSIDNFGWVETVMKDVNVKTLGDVVNRYYTKALVMSMLLAEQRSKWEKEIFALEPTAILAALVASNTIAVDNDVRPLVVNILEHAVTNGRNITRQPFRKIVHGYEFPNDTPTTTKTIALDWVKDIQRLQSLVLEPKHIQYLCQVLKSGERSAHYIAGRDVEGFVIDMKETELTAQEVREIHGRAFLIRMRNEQTWATILRTKTELHLPPLVGEGGESGDKPESKPPKIPPNTGVNYVGLFDEMESIECDDCESVLSPAAYFVDLLKTLQEVKVTDNLTLFDCLSERRPDLKDLELSCTNTKVLIPYIDLVNEVLESFVLNSADRAPTEKDKPVPIRAFNMQDTDTSALCEQRPCNLESLVYLKLIQPQFYPPTVFPYNHAVDSMRAFLETVGSSLADLRKSLGSEYRLVDQTSLSRPDSRESVLRASRVMVDRAIIAEKLGMQQEDVVAITRQGFAPIERLRLLGSDSTTLSEDEFEVRSGFPGTEVLWGYEKDSKDMLDVTNGQGLSFVKSQLLLRSGLSFGELVKILNTEFIAGRLILAPSDGSSQFTPKLDDLRLCASLLVDGKGQLTETLCHDLQAFLRLRKCTGWDIDVLDAALSCFNRSRTNQDGSRIYPETLAELASIRELSSLTTLDIELILPWWGSLYSNGGNRGDSLYCNLFLQHTFEGNDVFGADVEGRYLPEENLTTFSNATKALTSALEVSVTDLSGLQDILGLGSDPALTMANVSLVYRVVTFCQALSIPFTQYALFCDIFASNGADVFEAPSATLSIVSQWLDLAQEGWTLPQLANCLKVSYNDKSVGPVNRSNVIKTVSTILSSSKTIVATWPIVQLEQGEMINDDDLQKIMVALYGRNAAIEQMKSFQSEIQATKEEKETEKREPAEKGQTAEKGDAAEKREAAGEAAKNAVDKTEIINEKRNAKYNELVRELRARLLQQRIFDTVNADFPDIQASTIRLIISDMAKMSLIGTSTISQTSEVKTEPPMIEYSAMQLLQSLPEKVIDKTNASFTGFFSPTTTEKYCFLSKCPTSTLAIDDVPIQFINGSSLGIRLLSGQVYKIHYGGTFNQLQWRTDILPVSAFPEDIFLDEAIIQTAEQVYNAIARISSIVTIAKLDLGELQFFTGSLGSMIIDFNNISLNEIVKLQTYQKARASFSSAERSSLLAFYKWIAWSEKKADDLAKQICEVTGWSLTLVNDTLNAKYSSLSTADRIKLFNNVEEFATLKSTIDHISRVSVEGVSVEQMFKWAEPSTKLEDLFNQAREMREIFSGKNQGAGSPQTAVGKAYDRLRENQRIALIQYILNDPDLRNLASVVDSDSLFEYLLIDVNMGPKLQTSRIKQAISTIQLFVQRCMLGLEIVPGLAEKKKILVVADLKSKWQYMGKYTLWEANRKVFLYPENWADPTLRDNKSEQFKALESTILQNDVSLESITDSIKTFIFDTNTISNLDVQSYLWERQEEGTGRFHFFARTRTVPHEYFYRCMDLKVFGERWTYWYPWTKLDIGALPQSVDKNNKVPEGSSAYLVPSVIRGRLFLFVPEIMLRTREPNKEDSTSPPTTPPSDSMQSMATKSNSEIKSKTQEQYWEVKMAWTEFRNGKWSPKVFSPDLLLVEPKPGLEIPSLHEFRFGIRARNPGKENILLGSQVTSKATFANGIEGFLILDVESYTTGSDKKATVRMLGQFEMRNSQLYLKKPEDVQFPYRKTDQPTFPTRYAKLEWETSGLPDYKLVEEVDEVTIVDGKKSSTKVEIFSDPLLVGVSNKSIQDVKKLTWTISFDATQYTRPLGLVVDVITPRAGAQTYFARPPEKELSPRMKSELLTDHASVVLLDHPNSAILSEYAARHSQLEPIYKVMTLESTKEVHGLKFGKVADKVYHELFAPNSIYNWELGVHAVSLLMERLLATQQFEQAIQVARLVFDPTINGSDLRKCWLFAPFADKAIKAQSTEDLLQTLNPQYDEKTHVRQMTYEDMQVAEWQANPFNAHAVARGRPVTYMKRIVMKYIEILIAAGDQYFRQASLEAIPFAIQRYVEASHLFGPGMRRMKRLGNRPKSTYKDIVLKLDSFSNLSVDMELDFPFSCVRDATGTRLAKPDDPRQGMLGFITSTYFGVPTNPQLLALRDLIDDRLFKIRNCQDINGNPLRLPLFDPPLDPGMLVKAQAGGAQNLSMLLNDLDSPMPNYRFVYMLQKASEMVAELRSMGEFFLSAKEKRDSEAFSRLKSKQDTVIQSMMTQIKDLAKQEAIKSVEALQDLRKSHVSRLQYYLALIGEPRDLVPGEADEWMDIKQQIDEPTKDDLRMSINEKMEMEKANLAADLTYGASLIDTTAAALVALPNMTSNAQPMGMGLSIKFDASNVAKGMSGVSTVMKLMSEYNSNRSARAARKAQMIRQLQERRLQANSAGREIKNVDRQIATQRTRIAICDAEIKIQSVQFAQAQQTEEWYRSKYTNEELYAWMESSSRTLLYESYLLAIDLAYKTEKAFQFEYGVGKQTTFLNPQGYWDSGRDGLLAAQHLQIALKRMEAAYFERSPNDFEISKVISLRQINPQALFNLRVNAEAQFTLPEVLFDMDFPGQYYRRIKSVAVTVPCITGPYTSLNCTLSLLESRYRVSPATPNNIYAEKSGQDDRFRTHRIPISSIAVGERSLDSGRFDLNFAGERFLPFEGAGVLSTWKIELPNKVRQFDYDTISDVVLQIKYTSRQGGGKLKAASETFIEAYMKKATQLSQEIGPGGLNAVIDLKNDYSNEFLALTLPAVNGITLTGLVDRLPFWARGQVVQATNVALYVKTDDKKTPFAGSVEIDSAKVQNGQLIPESGWTKFAPASFTHKVTNWPVKIVASSEQIKKIRGALLFFGYTVSKATSS